MQKGFKIEVYSGALLIFLVKFVIFQHKIELFLCQILGILQYMSENVKPTGFFSICFHLGLEIEAFYS